MLVVRTAICSDRCHLAHVRTITPVALEIGSWSRASQVLKDSRLVPILTLAFSLAACERPERDGRRSERAMPPATVAPILPPVVVDTVRCERGYTAFATRAGGALCVRPADRADRSDPKRTFYFANSVLRATLDEAGVFQGSAPYPNALLLSVHAPHESRRPQGPARPRSR